MRGLRQTSRSGVRLVSLSSGHYRATGLRIRVDFPFPIDCIPRRIVENYDIETIRGPVPIYVWTELDTHRTMASRRRPASFSKGCGPCRDSLWKRCTKERMENQGGVRVRTICIQRSLPYPPRSSSSIMMRRTTMPRTIVLMMLPRRAEGHR